MKGELLYAVKMVPVSRFASNIIIVGLAELLSKNQYILGKEKSRCQVQPQFPFRGRSETL